MATEQKEPATMDAQDIWLDTNSQFLVNSDLEHDNDDNHIDPSSPSSDRVHLEETSDIESEVNDAYADVAKPAELITDEDELRTESDDDSVEEHINDISTEVEKPEYQSENQEEEEESNVLFPKAKETAKQHFIDAASNVPLTTVLGDFERSPEMPAFFRRIVKAYLKELRIQQVDTAVLDAARDAAVDAQEHLEVLHGRPKHTPISADAFKDMPSSENEDATSEESTASSVSDAFMSAPETEIDAHTAQYDRISIKRRRRLAKKVHQDDEMMLLDVTNEGPASPIATSDNSDNESTRVSTRSMTSIWRMMQQKKQLPRRRGLRLPKQIQEQVKELEGRSSSSSGGGGRDGRHLRSDDEDDADSLTGGLRRVKRRRRVESPEKAEPSQQQQQQQQQEKKTRRLYNPWTNEELDALSRGVQEFGPRWIRIKEEYEGVWRNRTNVDLKDKARNVVRQRQRNGQDLEHWASCARR